MTYDKKKLNQEINTYKREKQTRPIPESVKKKNAKEITEYQRRMSAYDDLPEKEKDAFWDVDGRLIFREVTRESEYAQFIIDRAFDLFIDGMTIEEIAFKWSIPQTTVAKWSKQQNWVKKVDAIKQQLDTKYTSQKAKKALSLREETDKRHTEITQWLQKEIAWELRVNQASNMIEEQRKKVRLQTLKLAVDCYATLINQERMIIGIKDETPSVELPTHFEFKLTAGTSGNPQDIDAEQLRQLLPSQNPHDFLPPGHTDTLRLPETISVESQPVISPNKPPSSIDPITIAQHHAFEDVKPEKKKRRGDDNPNPVFGYIPLN